jgi:hypothetical protein
VGADGATDARLYKAPEIANEEQEEVMELSIFDLHAMFPDDPDFIVEQALLKATHQDILRAYAKRTDVLLVKKDARIAELEAALERANTQTLGVTFFPAEAEQNSEPVSEPRTPAERADLMWKDESVRAEFPDKDILAAYLRAEEAGTAKVQGVHTKIVR